MDCGRPASVANQGANVALSRHWKPSGRASVHWRKTSAALTVLMLTDSAFGSDQGRDCRGEWSGRWEHHAALKSLIDNGFIPLALRN